MSIRKRHSGKAPHKGEQASDAPGFKGRMKARNGEKTQARDTGRDSSRDSARGRGRDSRRVGRGPAAAGDGLLYGIHPVMAALANPARICRRLFVTSETLRKLRDELAGLARTPPTPEIVDRGRIDDMLPDGAVHQGIALKADPLPEPYLEDACAPAAGSKNVVVLLDQVTDPHNVGAILRSSAAFGAKAVVVTERHAPPISGVLAKSASGAVETIPLVRVANLSRALEALKDLGYWRIGLDGAADLDLATAAKGLDKVALVLGAEGSGLRRLTREHCDHLARLPITSLVESLNVSNASAVALYELVREG